VQSIEDLRLTRGYFWDIGDYSVEVFVAGERVETLHFRVSPPEDAIPSRVTSAVVASRLDEEGRAVDPRIAFSPADSIRPGSTAVYAVYEFSGMRNGLECQEVWLLNGEEEVSKSYQYSVSKSMPEEWVGIVDWTESLAILPNRGVNHIGVRCQGSEMSLYVNGEHLVTVEDESFSKGDIGLFGTTFDEGGAVLCFDNVKVWRLTD